MKKSYRIAQETIYAQALKTVKVSVRKVTAHLDGSATISGNEKVIAAVKRLPDVEVISESKTDITFRLPAALEYHQQNPPRYTEEEKAKMEAEREARKAERRQRNTEDDAEMDEEEDESE